jgi:phosphoglycolate phosphatase-like HAD superfamily hydrolase
VKLALFDIDGTLTSTNELDDEVYLTALQSEFGIRGIDTDWSSYHQVTDPGILEEVFQTHRGRTPTPQEFMRFRDRFQALIHVACQDHDRLIRPIPGAAALLDALRRNGDWGVAFASGGWREPGRLKLRAAGLPVDSIPAAYADDASGREDIVRIALRRASQASGQESFDATVYVGDGLWDLRSARRLGIGFLGVGSGDAERQLRSEGAIAVLADFEDLTASLCALEDACR